ncbi:MAG: endonuclease V [Planctomycetia bacterium]|jgi:deoxyribonuclease V|nr:MAG: hypothetical protein B6D36_07170 [Planctomycetes bacterium UTPLA1]
MKLPRALHRWNVTPARAVAIQRDLADAVVIEPIGRRPRLVAGADCAFIDSEKRIVACWVVWDLRTRSVLETTHVVRPVSFPYVPGLLSFREAPAIIAAARRIRCEPDVFMLDGHGLAHPRRMGLACHVGLFLDRPTFGCAKSLLCGEYREPTKQRGANSPMLDKGELIGRIVRTHEQFKPVFVSVGHRITLIEAVKTAIWCHAGFRLPQPTRLADQLVAKLKAEIGKAESPSDES